MRQYHNKLATSVKNHNLLLNSWTHYFKTKHTDMHCKKFLKNKYKLKHCRWCSLHHLKIKICFCTIPKNIRTQMKMTHFTQLQQSSAYFLLNQTKMIFFLKTMFLKPTFKTTNKKSPNSIFIFHIHIPYSYLTNILNEINNQNIN